MNSTERIRIVAGGLLALLGIVLVGLFLLMVVQNDRWVRRSQENRWSFRSVPSLRGALFDRAGRRLAWDEPATELGLFYRRFRKYQPVGAAVHAATLLAAWREDGATYSYLPGPAGPEAALATVLAQPVGVLRPGLLAKPEFLELSTALVTVLAHATGKTRKATFAALRLAAQDAPLQPIGDVFAGEQETLLAGYAAALAALRELDLQLQQLGRAAALPGRERASLFDVLEEQRLAAIGLDERGLKAATAATEPDEPVPAEEPGRIEAQDRLQPVAREVPFEMAAALRLRSEEFAGLRVQPTFVRRHGAVAGSSLAAWLGGVADLDRSMPPAPEAPVAALDAATGAASDQDDPAVAAERQRQAAERQAAHRRRFAAGFAPAEEWLHEVVPAGFVDAAADQTAFQAAALATYHEALLAGERCGTRGLEMAFDAVLRGRMGMRFVERDNTRREQQLFGHLEVRAGTDVRLTIDTRLQALTEAHLERRYERMRLLHLEPGDQQRVGAALAWIDATTGDVLAYGAVLQERLVDPQTKAKTFRLSRTPGLPYDGNPDLGSVAKPFVMIEHLRAEALGGPHHATAAMEPCSGKWVFEDGRRLGCLKAHGAAGRDPVQAIAESCNTFFFQAAMGFGEEGLWRAYARFGIVDDVGGPFAAARQARIPGLPGWSWSRPRMDPASAVLPMRGVGYGIYALPVDVARAYAALATGYLPTLGLLAGERRAVVPIEGLDAERSLVAEGLRQCVTTGTARQVRFPPGLEVFGKTGTAEVGRRDKQNNAWFAGYLGQRGPNGEQLAFAAVLYWVPHGVHGGDEAGQLVADVLADLRMDPELAAAFLAGGGGR